MRVTILENTKTSQKKTDYENIVFLSEDKFVDSPNITIITDITGDYEDLELPKDRIDHVVVYLKEALEE